MDRKELIRLYLDAETTVAQEKVLADSFAANPPADKEEMAVFLMLQDLSGRTICLMPKRNST